MRIPDGILVIGHALLHLLDKARFQVATRLDIVVLGKILEKTVYVLFLHDDFLLKVFSTISIRAHILCVEIVSKQPHFGYGRPIER